LSCLVDMERPDLLACIEEPLTAPDPDPNPRKDEEVEPVERGDLGGHAWVSAVQPDVRHRSNRCVCAVKTSADQIPGRMAAIF
jgi:hypothetical protein